MKNKQKLFSITKKDFNIKFYKGSGSGGQHKNKTETCCRITHPASGAVAISEDERSQHQNKKKAFERIIKTKKFQEWLKIETAKALGQIEDVEKKVDEWMKEENLKIEYLGGENNDKNG